MTDLPIGMCTLSEALQGALEDIERAWIDNQEQEVNRNG